MFGFNEHQLLGFLLIATSIVMFVIVFFVQKARVRSGSVRMESLRNEILFMYLKLCLFFGLFLTIMEEHRYSGKVVEVLESERSKYAVYATVEYQNREGEKIQRTLGSKGELEVMEPVELYGVGPYFIESNEYKWKMRKLAEKETKESLFMVLRIIFIGMIFFLVYCCFPPKKDPTRASASLENIDLLYPHLRIR